MRRNRSLKIRHMRQRVGSEVTGGDTKSLQRETHRVNFRYWFDFGK